MTVTLTVEGMLTLQIGEESVPIGTISIPVTARVTDGGYGPVVLESPHAMKEVRDFVQEVFGEQERGNQ